jgi:hypothetical protein
MTLCTEFTKQQYIEQNADILNNFSAHKYAQSADEIHFVQNLQSNNIIV